MKHKSSASARFDIGWLPRPAAARRYHWLGTQGLGRREVDNRHCSSEGNLVPHLSGQPPINSSTYVREGAGHRQKVDPLRHYKVVESGGGGHSRAGASDSSLCATMLERTSGVLWVTRRKWTEWGQLVRNQSRYLLYREGWEGFLG